MAEEKKPTILRAQEAVTPRSRIFGTMVANPNLEKAIKPGVPEGLQPPKAPPKVYPGQTKETLGQSRVPSGHSDGNREATKDQSATKE